MKVRKLLATNPTDGQYVGLIRDAYEFTKPTVLHAAVAYVTQSGVAELEAELGKLAGWGDARKRWLVGVDYCRSDPVALAYLNGLRRSKVRIYDGEFVCGRVGCVPRDSYHPKVYCLRGDKRSAVVVGSGNLSRTGLRLGIEAAAAIAGPNDGANKELTSWFSNHWRKSTPFQDIQERYEQQYESLGNRRHPIPVEDDEIPESATSRGQIGANDLRKLRVCRHFWIEAGNLHLNLGRVRPGNQLMLKRNSRVFFGFSARDLKPNTGIGNVAIQFGRHWRPNCALRFRDNSMDVLALPIPGEEGPAAYDQETLLFERVGVRKFNVTIGRPADREALEGQIKSNRRAFSNEEWA